MSTTIDQKVVEMRFDNGQFESSVATTMSTVSKLKQSLNFGDTAQQVGLSFNAMYTYADHTMRRITDTVNGYAKRIVSALTIDPIMTGFSEYETKIGSIQTIMSNTASKGTTMEDVTRVIGELNTYADKTIYNFAEMTRNIGTFTAAGIGLEESAKAIQGIANLAAVSGSNSQQASTAMYQLSQAMASGTVKLMDWNSVVNAGMGGQVFQDALKDTAKAHGVAVDEIIKKHGSFRESLSEGWITTEILTETLSKMTKSGAAEYLAKLTGVEQDQIQAAQELVANNKDGTASYEELAETLAKTGKISKEDAIDILKMADNAEDAATKVKTITQLFDTLKESAQSGWSQTWEIIVGDFEEAKDFLTEVSEVIGGMIGKSADARNEMLENWKVLGGRTALLDSIRNTFEGIMNIIKPISEGFREIFPKVTSTRLFEMTERLRDFTETFKEKFEEGSVAANNLKRTFRGLFAVIDIGVMFIKAIGDGLLRLVGIISPAGDGILRLTGNLGDNLVELRNYIKNSELFPKAINKIVDAIENCVPGIKKFVSNVGKAFSSLGKTSVSAIGSFVDRVQKRFGSLEEIGEKIGKIFTGIGSVVKKVFSVISIVGGAIRDVLGGIFNTIGNALKEGDFSTTLDLVNTLLTGGLLIALTRLMNWLPNIGKQAKKGIKSIVNSIRDLMDGVTDTFEAFTASIKSDTLMKIAKAIGILTLSLFGLSLIDSEALTKALLAITWLFVDLFGSMAIFEKVMGGAGGDKNAKLVDKIKNNFEDPIVKLSGCMVTISFAILLLSSALVNIGKLDPEEMRTGLAAVTILLFSIVEAMKMLSSVDKNNAVVKGTKRILAIGTAIKIISTALISMAELSWNGIYKGLVGVAICVGAIVLIMESMPESIPTKALSAMIGASASIWIMAKTFKEFGGMNWNTIAKGLVGMGASVGLIVGAFWIMEKFEKSIVEGARAMLIAGVAITTLVPFFSVIGSMSWESLAKSMIGIVAVLGAMVGAFALMSKASGDLLTGSAAMVIMSAALLLMIPTLLILGSMSWESIAKGLVTLAGAFVIIGVAAYALQPVIGVVVALGVTIGLIGAGMALAGVGMLSFALGLAAVSAALIAFSGSMDIVAKGITSAVSAFIVGIIKGFGAGIIALGELIVNCAGTIVKIIVGLIEIVCSGILETVDTIATTVLELIVSVLKSLAEYTPKIVTYLFDFLIGLLEGVADRMPELIQAVVDIFMSVFEGAIAALGDVDPSTLIEGLKAVGLMAGIMLALAALVPLVPLAMLGVIGMGAVAAELAVVLGTIGALAQISGLKWLVEEGGDFLLSIGNAIGKFVGGIVGGIAEGVTSALPQIGTDLADFMNNLRPFIDGASSIDSSSLDGVKSLVGIILALTGANIIDGLTSWFTGGSALSKFGEEIAAFAPCIKEYADTVAGIDPAAVQASASAGKMLAELAASLPNSGGLLGAIVGNNDLGLFAEGLVPFGEGMRDYGNAVAGINAQSIIESVNAARAFIEMASIVPNEGGIVAWFSGENSIANFGSQLTKLGEGLKGFSDTVVGVVPANLIAAAQAAQVIAEMTSTIPNSGGVASWFAGENSIAKFGGELVALGMGLKGFSDSIIGINPTGITAAAMAGKALAEMASVVPNEGGMVAWFKGENSLSKFSGDLIAFGQGLRGFSATVIGIDPAGISTAVTAGKELAEMASIIPNEGGMVAWFKGENSLSKFGGDLIALGRGLKGFGESIVGVNPEAMTAAASAARSLAELTSYIPNEGGIKSWFTGEASVSKFSDDLKALGGGLKGFNDQVTGINPETLIAASNSAKALAEMTSYIPNEGGVKQWFTGEASLSKFSGDLKSLGEGLKGFSDSITGVNPENISAASNAAKSLAEMTQIIPKEGGIKAWFTGESSIAKFACKLPDLGEGLKGFSDSVGGINPENVTAAADAAKSIAQMMDTMPRDVDDITTCGKNLTKLSEKLKTYFSNMGSISSESISASSNALAAVKDVSEINAGNIKDVADAIKKLSDSVKTMSKNIKSDMKTAGKAAMEGFINGIKDKLESAKDSCTSLVEKCASAITSKSTLFKDAGRDMADGFAAGIEANTYKAKAKARAMAKAAADAAEEELDINSPSKVLMDIGTSVPEGFAMGIGKLGNMVVAASANMGDDAVTGVSNSIARIADLINSDIDAQPTIRPVLDLSDVRAGASTIGGLFGNSSVGVLANVGSVSSMMSRYNNQNGTNNDVVSAIDKLRDGLNNVGNTTYQIGDVVYGEGSEVADAIQTIIKAIIRNGRM